MKNGVKMIDGDDKKMIPMDPTMPRPDDKKMMGSSTMQRFLPLYKGNEMR